MNYFPELSEFAARIIVKLGDVLRAGMTPPLHAKIAKLGGGGVYPRPQWLAFRINRSIWNYTHVCIRLLHEE
jgi:hypothetical protein